MHVEMPATGIFSCSQVGKEGAGRGHVEGKKDGAHRSEKRVANLYRSRWTSLVARGPMGESQREELYISLYSPELQIEGYALGIA